MSYPRAENDNSPLTEVGDRSGQDDIQRRVEGQNCPICDKTTVYKYRPFCSKRCADVDLGRWLSDGYAIAGQADAEEDGTLPTQEQDLEEKFK